jgi:hypothetical protein
MGQGVLNGVYTLNLMNTNEMTNFKLRVGIIGEEHLCPAAKQS